MNAKGVFNHCGWCFYRRRADTHVHHSSWFENWKKKWEDIMPWKKSTQYYLPRDFRHDFNLLLVKSVFGWDLLVGCKMVTLSSLTATKSRSSREDIGGRYTTTKKVLWHNLTKSQKESWLKTAQRTIPDAELLENGFWLVVEKHSRRPAILIKDAQLKGEGKREEGRKSSNFSVTLKRYYQSCVNYH